MQRQERRAEAGGEGWGWLGHTALGTRQFSGKAGEEMVLRLAGGQAGNRWQHAECICGQENHLRGVTRLRYRLDDVLDVVDRVRDAGVFRFRGIVEVDRTIGTHGDVFQQRIAANRVVDIRLCLFRQANGLSVAAAFKVKHAVIIPAVFIVANQTTFWIGGQRCFTGAGKAEEHCYIAFFPDVRRAVHGGDTAQRQQVVHDREHPFLHFAAVPGTADQLDTLGQVEGDEVFGVQTLLFPLRVGAFRAVHHDKVRGEVLQFFIGRTNEHVLHEMRLPGHFSNEPYGETGVGVSAAERINNKQTLAGKLMGDKSFQMLPGFRGERFVIVLPFALISPPQRIAGGVVSDDILIFRRTTGKNTRIDGDSTQVRQHTALVSFQCRIELFLIQRIVIGVVDHFLDVVNTISLEILRG